MQDHLMGLGFWPWANFGPETTVRQTGKARTLAKRGIWGSHRISCHCSQAGHKHVYPLEAEYRIKACTQAWSIKMLPEQKLSVTVSAAM